MNKSFFVIPFFIILVSCSVEPSKKQSGWRSDDTSKIDRTKKLIACSKFFKVIAKQRPNDREEFDGLYKKSESLAFSIMPSYKENGANIKTELTRKYTTYGNYITSTWVKSIGKDKSGKLFPEITKDCYETVQREDLFNTVNELSTKMDLE